MACFTVQQECAHLRASCVALEKENSDLRAGVNLDKYQAQCEKKAEERNVELARTVRTQEKTINRLTRESDTLHAKLEKALSTQKALRDQVEELKHALSDAEHANRGLNRSNETAERKIEELKAKLKDANDKVAAAEKQIGVLNKQIEQLATQNGQLSVIVNRNSGNSSISPSKNGVGVKKPVVNSKKPSGKTPGAQPQHVHHPRLPVTLPDGGVCYIYGKTDPLWRNPEYEFLGYAAFQSRVLPTSMSGLRKPYHRRQRRVALNSY